MILLKHYFIQMILLKHYINKMMLLEHCFLQIKCHTQNLGHRAIIWTIITTFCVANFDWCSLLAPVHTICHKLAIKGYCNLWNNILWKLFIYMNVKWHQNNIKVTMRESENYRNRGVHILSIQEHAGKIKLCSFFFTERTQWWISLL